MMPSVTYLIILWLSQFFLPLFCDALDFRVVAIDVPLRADHSTIVYSPHFTKL